MKSHSWNLCLTEIPAYHKGCNNDPRLYGTIKLVLPASCLGHHVLQLTLMVWRLSNESWNASDLVSRSFDTKAF